jgi:hypothetical protein
VFLHEHLGSFWKKHGVKKGLDTKYDNRLGRDTNTKMTIATKLIPQTSGFWARMQKSRPNQL